MRKTFYFLIILATSIFFDIVQIPFLPFDSDQAIVGLMGKHILEGSLPWFYYGDPYGGILEPLLASWSFLFMGINRFSLHVIPFLFSSLFIVSIYQLGRELFNREVGLLSMLLAAIPSFSVGLYSSLAYGGYSEIIWLGNIILLLTHRLAIPKKPSSLLPFFFLGLLWGIAWWTYPLSIIYIISSFCFLLLIKKWSIRKEEILVKTVGFFLGSSPFWIWNGIHHFPFLTFTRSQQGLTLTYKINNFYHQLLWFFNPNLREYVTFTSFFLVILFLLSLLFLILKKKWISKKFPSRYGQTLLLLFLASFCFIYIGSRFSEKNVLRYLLPLYSLVPIALALFCYAVKTKSAYGLGLLVILLTFTSYQQWSLTVFLINNSKTYQKQLQAEKILFDFLKKKNYHYAYNPEYWSAAELTFNARENPVFTLPFKDRYPLYSLLADASSGPVFVLEGKHRNSFEEMFRAAGGTYKKEVIAPHQKIKGYVVYYDFKAPETRCQEILPDLWTGKSNANPGPEKSAFDRNISTTWTSSAPQKPGMFFQIDLGRIYKLNRIVSQCGKEKEWDFPAHYRLELSKNGHDWTEVSSVKNNWAYLFWSGGRPFWKLRDGRLENTFNPQEARFIKITVTAPAPHPWTIGELFVYQAAEQFKAKTLPVEEIIAFLSREKIEYVYADISLSAQLTLATRGQIKCLQDDYDITHGGDYSMWGYNDAFPYFNKLKKQVDFSLSPAFVVAEENKTSFQRAMNTMNVTYSVKDFGDQLIYYGLRISEPAKTIKGGGALGSFYWNGTHLLHME